MKKRILSTVLAVMVLMGASSFKVSAQDKVVLTGTLSTATISVDGQPPITIQSYNVGGYNYVRARQITELLDMNILGDSNGIMIQPYEVAEISGDMEKLTDKNISVSMKDGFIYYSGYNSIETSYFNYKDRNYFKLADLSNAAEEHKISRLKTVPIFSKPPLDYESIMRTFTVTWDTATNTVIITTETTDLLNHYNVAKGITPQETKQNPSTTAAPPMPDKPKTHEVLPEYKSANEIPEFPAKIMIDSGKGFEVSNLTYPFRLTGLYGECTWYAIGRFYEVFGIDLASGDNNIYGKGNWVEESMSGKYSDIEGIPYLGNGDISNIPNRGIAEWNGHVVFIEFVERDTSGNPLKIYFTESNAGRDGIDYVRGNYYPDVDGKLGSVVGYNFLSMVGESNFKGFLVPKK